MRILPFALPFVALLIVGAVAVGLKLATGGGGPGTFAAREETAEPATPTPAVTRATKLQPGQTVCQGTLSRPEKGAPRTFPSLYTQKRDVLGLTIVADRTVSEEAFAEAETTIRRVFANRELLTPLLEEGAYVIIAGRGVGILDLPEFSCLSREAAAGVISHACGIADRADYPVVTVNESDLLGERSGPCRGLNILYHELGHLVQSWSIPPPDYFEVKQLYQDALSAGKYQNRYAATNPNEYFAEATQAYFLALEPGLVPKDRAWLKEYDPGIYAVMERVYGR